MNLMLIIQTIFFLIILRLEAISYKILGLVILSLIGTVTYFYGNELNVQFDLLTFLFYGLFILAILLKQNKNLLLIGFASFSLYPNDINQTFFLQTVIFSSLYLSGKELPTKDKLSCIFGLIIWPVFFILDNLSFSYELKFACGVLLSFLMIMRAQKIELSSVAFYSLIISQIIFLKAFEFQPVFTPVHMSIIGSIIFLSLVNKGFGIYLLPVVKVSSIVFCGLKVLPFFTTYFMVKSLREGRERVASDKLNKPDIFRLIMLGTLIVLSLSALNNYIIALAFLVLLSLGRSKTFFATLQNKNLKVIETLTYVILLLMNSVLVFYV